MKKTNFKNIFGYIEGYYGNLLNWNSRKRIIRKMSSIGMNFYFYAPKEDIFHRLNWRTNYTLKWREKFRDFCKFASNNNVQVIAGISPGIDINYKSKINNSNDFFNKDIDILLNKFRNFIDDGAGHVALLFDDISREKNRRLLKKEEGRLHACLTNIISHELKKEIFLVPRIYADELIIENKFYLGSLLKELKKNVQFFYCGKYVVNNEFETNSNLVKSMFRENKVIFWDNYYANDYCPKKIFLGPWLVNKKLNKVMLNLTGMIETDLLILEMVTECRNSNYKFKTWKKVFTQNKIPKEFFRICKFFEKPYLTSFKSTPNINLDLNMLDDLDELIWKWKTPLSREWYPYLLNLKYDLQIFCNELSSKRILKTQTYPIAKKILNINGV